MADITQTFSQLLLTYGPGAMLDLPDNAVVVAGLQDWRYGPNWKPVEEERLVTLLREQLGDKLSPGFHGLRQPPFFDEERRDANAPGVEVRLFPEWFVVDERSSGQGDGESSSPTEKRRRIVKREPPATPACWHQKLLVKPETHSRPQLVGQDRSGREIAHVLVGKV